MSLSSLENIILITLNQNRGAISVFFLFKISKVPMAEFMKTLSSLRNGGLVRLAENKVFLEAAGLKHLMRDRHGAVSRTHPGVPTKMLRPYQLNIDAPYAPAVSRLDKRLFSSCLNDRLKSEGGR